MQDLVLNFGSRAGVWHYNRFSDVLVALMHLLLFTTVGHYVDDFTGEEQAKSAQSAADAADE